ncbi:MAG: ABC transporter ATP-binding protein [Lachnospiraceae bacterium]|nr:ABC transporter ATP-binding protein [Lachnospiraceae bacterium]
MKDAPLISVKDLVVEYTSGDEVVHAVNGVSFELQAGETLGLVGETGAGKTTIAKAILGILPDPPAKVRSGEIYMNDRNLLQLSEKEMRKIRGNKIAMIFQDPMTALNPMFVVGDQISEVIRLHEKISKADATKKSMELLEMVGIPGERYSEYPHQFSGGMKQRVVIAMALACNPELLLADEPTTALDVTIQAQVLEMMMRLRDERNTAMVMITHDLGIVAEVCDRVAVVYAGEIVEIGSKEHIFDFTSHPYTEGLFNSLPNLNTTAKRLNPIPGMMPNPSDLPEGCKFHPRCPYTTEACKTGEISLREEQTGHFIRCLYSKEGRK